MLGLNFLFSNRFFLSLSFIFYFSFISFSFIFVFFYFILIFYCSFCLTKARLGLRQVPRTNKPGAGLEAGVWASNPTNTAPKVLAAPQFRLALNACVGNFRHPSS
jgi:hypothetical protein